MDEVKNTISILGDEISDFRDRADDILSTVYEKIEEQEEDIQEQEEYIEELESCLIDLVYGFTIKEIEEFGVGESDARHIYDLVNTIAANREEDHEPQEEAACDFPPGCEHPAFENPDFNSDESPNRIETVVNELKQQRINWPSLSLEAVAWSEACVSTIVHRTGCSEDDARQAALKMRRYLVENREDNIKAPGYSE